MKPLTSFLSSLALISLPQLIAADRAATNITDSIKIRTEIQHGANDDGSPNVVVVSTGTNGAAGTVISVSSSSGKPGEVTTHSAARTDVDDMGNPVRRTLRVSMADIAKLRDGQMKLDEFRQKVVRNAD